MCELRHLQVIMCVRTFGSVCPFAIDLAFLLDASWSTGPSNFQTMKESVNKIIDHFHVSDEGTHIGVVSFSDEANTELRFTDKQEVTKIKASVLAIKNRNGSTRTDKGLLKCRLSLFSAESGTRANVPRVLLVITDGRSYRRNRTRKEYRKLKRRGISIFAVGIGSRVRLRELRAMASQRRHVFQVTAEGQMMPLDISLKVSLALCSVGRTSYAIIHPVVPQHSLEHHPIMSKMTYDDMECALLCIKHSSCYSFNFHSSSGLCELSYARRSDFPKDLSFDLASTYSELDFMRGESKKGLCA
ncbi:matrilin-4-like isoform X2 [Montipora foliosa]|uniref:matrilin-4-like isoform X2 n=1 Tax=Montipora foliosa TaxID=591990 RepID=UPI0035F14033